jgi:hypothetical protein
VDTEGTSGRIVYIETNKRTEDTIEQIYMLQPADKNENVGYATQKPEALVGRIVSAKATKAASAPTSVKAAAQRLLLPKSSTSSGSPPIWANSPSTPTPSV